MALGMQVPSLAAASGLCVAWSAWMVLGFSRPEVMRARHALRSMAVLELKAAATLGKTLAACVRGLLGVRGGDEESVGLGEVSELIDIVRLGLSAGLSFDAALGLYCEGRGTRLAHRFERARLCWQSGVSTREEALLGVARDVGVRALESFAVSVSQALELGAPLAQTLAGQSREIRAAHRSDVERQIERAPVKLLIPTGTLILPALLLSILGPLLAASGMI